MVHLFVYGSLKRGFENHGLLAKAMLLDASALLLGYELIGYEGGYPGIRAAKDQVVEGELYAVSLRKLEELDVFEECPQLYRRELVELVAGGVSYTYVASRPERGSALGCRSWKGSREPFAVG